MGWGAVCACTVVCLVGEEKCQVSLSLHEREACSPFHAPPWLRWAQSGNSLVSKSAGRQGSQPGPAARSPQQGPVVTGHKAPPGWRVPEGMPQLCHCRRGQVMPSLGGTAI